MRKTKANEMENRDHTDNPHLDAGRVVVDDVEDIDEAEEDGDQQAHPPGHNLTWKKLISAAFYIRITSGGIMNEVHETRTNSPDGK